MALAFRLVALLFAIICLPACGDLLESIAGDSSKEKSCNPKTENCNPTPNPNPCDESNDCVPPGCDENFNDGSDNSGNIPVEPNDEDAASDQTDAKLPFNLGAPLPKDEEVADPSPPLDPCHVKPNPNPHPVPTECTENNFGLDAANEPPVQSESMCVVGANETPPNLVNQTGAVASLDVKWQVLAGVVTYTDALAACNKLGTDWRLPASKELTTILTTDGATIAKTTGCLTSFWVGEEGIIQSPGSPNSCRASTIGFIYDAVGGSSPLPFNQEAVYRAHFEKTLVTTPRNVMCVTGLTKPAVSCHDKVHGLFSANPLGVVDPQTGKAWAKITASVDLGDVSAVTSRCSLGAADGWRIPSAAELEAAIAGNVFSTKEYVSDASCPLAWHEIEADSTNESGACMRLSLEGSEVAHLPADACLATAGFGFKVEPPKDGKLVGLCVKDK